MNAAPAKPSRRKIRKDKRELLRQKNRRTQIIMEAKRIHEKARKKQKQKDSPEVSIGAAAVTVKSMEQEDLALAIGMGVEKGIAKAIMIGGNALSKLKKRSRALKKNKSSHLKRLKKARQTMVQRTR